MTKTSPDETIAEFKKCVNMKSKELEDFLQTDESKDVGWSNDGGESVGHKSGRYIVELLQKDDHELTEEDVAHMRKVVGYVHRHSAQGPSKHDVEHSKWRYSLMNWSVFLRTHLVQKCECDLYSLVSTAAKKCLQESKIAVQQICTQVTT